MTFRDWANNPSGKGSAVMSTKQMYREMYDKKLNLLILREGNNFKYTLYKSKDEHTFYIHIKIPSEVIKNLYYDVVVMFYTKNPAYSVGTTLDKYDIKVFSNSPDFMFTHAHAYSKQGLLFDDLITKIPKASVKNTAKERNPKDEIGYIKSIYFTYLIMKQKGLFNKVLYKTAPVYNKKELLNVVMACEEKAKLRQEAEAAMRAEERKKKRLEQRKETEESNVGRTSSKSKFVSTTKKVSTSPTSKRTKYSNKIGGKK